MKRKLIVFAVALGMLSVFVQSSTGAMMYSWSGTVTGTTSSPFGVSTSEAVSGTFTYDDTSPSGSGPATYPLTAFQIIFPSVTLDLVAPTTSNVSFDSGTNNIVVDTDAGSNVIGETPDFPLETTTSLFLTFQNPGLVPNEMNPVIPNIPPALATNSAFLQTAGLQGVASANINIASLTALTSGPTPGNVPEPSTFLIWIAGLVTLGFTVWRRRRA